MRRPSPRGEDTRPTVSGTAPPHQPSHRTPDAGRPARPSAPVHHVGDSATTPVTPRRSRRCSSRHSTNRPKGRNCRTRYGSRRPRRRCRLGSVHATRRAQQPGRRIRGLRHHVLPVTVGASQGETVGERGKRLRVPRGSVNARPSYAASSGGIRCTPTSPACRIRRGATGPRYGSSVSTACQGPRRRVHAAGASRSPAPPAPACPVRRSPRP